MKSGIYAIVSPSGKMYIGSAVNIARRWQTHASELRRGVHHCEALQRAANKYGVDALQFEILERCEREQLIDREQSYFDLAGVRHLYNSAPVAGSTLGRTLTAETRAKIGTASRGRTLTAETRAKIGTAIRGRTHSAESRANMAAAKRGRTHSAETRAKISTAQRGRPGKKHSAETRAKISTAQAVGKTGRRGIRRSGTRFLARIGSRPQRYLGTYATADLAYTWRLAYLAVTEFGAPV